MLISHVRLQAGRSSNCRMSSGRTGRILDKALSTLSLFYPGAYRWNVFAMKSRASGDAQKSLPSNYLCQLEWFKFASSKR